MRKAFGSEPIFRKFGSCAAVHRVQLELAGRDLNSEYGIFIFLSFPLSAKATDKCCYLIGKCANL